MSNVRSITPNEPADFTPTLGNYKTLKPFRYWCQKVLPLVYDDSLSYYELLCKVVDYLNKTMEDVETLHGDVTNLHTAYEKLQGYVNSYFSTLDVQKEINNKLDEMANDGTLTTILKPYLNDLTNKINYVETNYIKNADGSVNWNNLSQEVKENITGGNTPVVGVNSVGTENIINGSVTNEKRSYNTPYINNNMFCTATSIEDGKYWSRNGVKSDNANYEIYNIPNTLKPGDFFGLVYSYNVNSGISDVIFLNSAGGVITSSLTNDNVQMPYNQFNGFSNCCLCRVPNGCTTIAISLPKKSAVGHDLKVYCGSIGSWYKEDVVNDDRLRVNGLDCRYVHGDVNILSGIVGYSPYDYGTSIGGYIGSRGFTYGNNIYMLFPMPANEIETIYSPDVEGFSAMGAWLDENFNLITTYGSGFVTPPDNAKYVTFYSIAHADYEVYRNKTIIFNKPKNINRNVLQIGAKGVAFGTSLTALSTTSYGYLPYLATILNSNIENKGIGSATYVGSSDALNITHAVLEYDIPDDLNFAILEGCVNDWGSSRPLGNIGDTEDTTVCGAFYTCAKKFLDAGVNVYIILDYTGTGITDTDAVINGYTQEQYYETIANYMEKYGIKCVKCYKGCGISKWTPNMLKDNIHPNEKGARRMAMFIGSELNVTQYN